MRTGQLRSNRFLRRAPFLVVIVLGGTASALAQPVPAESVEELRLLLKAPVTELSRRDRALGEKVKLLDGINDLRRALGRGEWRDQDPDERVAAVDQRHRAVVAQRFEQSLRDVFQQGDATRRLAGLHLLGKMVTGRRAVGTKKPVTRTFAPALPAL